MSHILRLTFFSGLLLLSIACGLSRSPGGDQTELEESSTSETPQTELALDTTIPGDSPLPTVTSVSESLAEDCILTSDEPSTFPAAPDPSGAPASPNQTLITGIVRCVWQVQASSLNIQPEIPIFIAEIEIVEAADVEGFMNGLNGQEGQTIKLFSKTAIPLDAAGRTIEVLVTFRGDEHGGKYWVIDDQLSIS